MARQADPPNPNVDYPVGYPVADAPAKWLWIACTLSATPSQPFEETIAAVHGKAHIARSGVPPRGEPDRTGGADVGRGRMRVS